MVHYMVVAYADLTALAASSDPTMEEVSLGAAYTPALTSTLVTPVAAGTIPSTGTLAAGEAVTATVSMTAQTGFYQVFVVTEGPNGNLGDGDARRTTNENPTKLAPCLVPQSDSSDDYYQKTMSWTTADTTLTAKAFLTAPATVHYVLLRSGSPAPNPTQVLEGKDSALATPPCQDYVNPDGDDWLDVRCYFADNSKTDTAGSTCAAPRIHPLGRRHAVRHRHVHQPDPRRDVRPVHGHDPRQRHRLDGLDGPDGRLRFTPNFLAS